MGKKLLYLSMIIIIIFIFAFTSYTWHTRYLFDLPNMDLSLDFALVDGNLVFCAKDGIYCVDVSNPENRQFLIPKAMWKVCRQPVNHLFIWKMTTAMSL